MKALIIVPTYNEAMNIAKLLERILSAAPSAEVLVVDDNSPDGTGDLIDTIVAKEPRVHVLHRAGKLGLGTAYLEGFRWGLSRDFDIIIEMDADFSHDPIYLPVFINKIEAGADVVVGSRNIDGGRVVGWGPLRHFISKGGSLYSRTILGINVRDLTSGYKAFRASVLRAIDLDSVKSNGYSFQIELTYRALKRGFKVQETPIVFVDRQAGASKMSGSIFREAIVMVWQLRLQK